MLTFSIVATAWLSYSSIRIESTYLQNYGFFFDPAAYYLHNIAVYQFYETHGQWDTLIHELFNNERCPGRVIPYIILSPKLLATLWGHMWTQMPVLLAFLVLLSSTIYKKSQSLLLATGSIVLFSGIPFLYHPTNGLAAYWLDLTSACALGSAAVCLIRYADARQQRWMYAFGAFCSIAALCRWSAAFYVLTFAALALPLVLFGRSHPWKRSLLDLACAVVTALPGLLFLFSSWKSNAWYYKTFGYAFGAPISQSLTWTSGALKEMIGMPIIWVLALSTAVGAVLLTRTKFKAPLVLSLWFPVSVLVFVCVVVKAVDGFHPLVYFAPALFVAGFCPLSTIRSNPIWLRLAASLMIAIGLFSAIDSYELYRRFAKSPSPERALQKRCDSALANLIVSSKAETATQFDTETCMPHLEAFFFNGTSCASVALFSKHESYLKFIFKNQTPEEMAASACRQVRSDLDLVAVFTDPAQALKPGTFNNSYSATVSNRVSEYVSKDPAFKFVANVDGIAGKLSVYRNTAFKKRSAKQ